MRLFLAINVPDDVRRAVVDATAPLRAIAPALSWVREPQLHLTLKFLGEQPEDVADAVANAMTAVGAKHRPVPAELGGVGAFPNFRRPNVVWMGVSPEPKLELLHHDVECAAATLGFALDGRPFRPHLTLARVKPRRADADALRALARAVKQIDLVEEIVVDSVDLMQSELSSSGSRYRVLARAPLTYV